jgi:hypothetical protein
MEGAHLATSTPGAARDWPPATTSSTRDAHLLAVVSDGGPLAARKERRCERAKTARPTLNHRVPHTKRHRSAGSW